MLPNFLKKKKKKKKRQKRKKKAALNIKSCGTYLILKHPSGHEHRNVSLVHYFTVRTLKLFCIHLSKINA